MNSNESSDNARSPLDILEDVREAMVDERHTKFGGDESFKRNFLALAAQGFHMQEQMHQRAVQIPTCDALT